jgi:hypothetical protein
LKGIEEMNQSCVGAGFVGTGGSSGFAATGSFN